MLNPGTKKPFSVDISTQKEAIHHFTLSLWSFTFVIYLFLRSWFKYNLNWSNDLVWSEIRRNARKKRTMTQCYILGKNITNTTSDRPPPWKCRQILRLQPRWCCDNFQLRSGVDNVKQFIVSGNRARLTLFADRWTRGRNRRYTPVQKNNKPNKTNRFSPRAVPSALCQFTLI